MEISCKRLLLQYIGQKNNVVKNCLLLKTNNLAKKGADIHYKCPASIQMKHPLQMDFFTAN